MTYFAKNGVSPFPLTTQVDLAHKLGLQVVAEGVEHQSQLDKLVALGCEKAQGYLFSRALPPHDVGRLVASFGIKTCWMPSEHYTNSRSG